MVMRQEASPRHEQPAIAWNGPAHIALACVCFGWAVHNNVTLLLTNILVRNYACSRMATSRQVTVVATHQADCAGLQWSWMHKQHCLCCLHSLLRV